MLGRWITTIFAALAGLITGVGPSLLSAIVNVLQGLSFVVSVGLGVRKSTDYNVQESTLKAAGYPDWAFIAGPIAYVVATIQAVSTALQAKLAIFGRRVVRQANFDRPEVGLSPADIVRAIVQSAMTEADGRRELQFNGVAGANADRLIAIGGEPLAPGQALDLFNRWRAGLAKDGRKYDEAWVRQALNESALKPKYSDAIMDLADNFLGASDYIRFAVRDAYTTDPALAAALDQDFPQVLGPLLQALGYRPDDARAAWRAHWDLPSPTQVFEMLHRGVLPPGDPDTVVADYLKQADYDPRWREPLKAISYNPITRTDAKRAYKLGLGGFDEARLKQAYMDLGYNARDADILVAFTRLDVGEEARAERELLVGPVRTQALNLYKARRIDEAELRRVLTNLKYPADIIDRYVADIAFVRDADHRDDVANALKSAYTKALRSRDDTRAYLLTAGWSEAAADDLLDTWTLIREATELQPHQAETRDLTKAEILAAYAGDVVDRDAATTSLVALGYDDAEAGQLLAMADLKAAKARQDDEVENAHLNYLRFAHDDAGVTQRLIELGLPVVRTRNLVMKWAAEREKRTPDFSVANLEQMVKARVMPENVAEAYLAAQGYTSEQRFYLLNWWLGRRQAAEARASGQVP